MDNLKTNSKNSEGLVGRGEESQARDTNRRGRFASRRREATGVLSGAESDSSLMTVTSYRLATSEADRKRRKDKPPSTEVGESVAEAKRPATEKLSGTDDEATIVASKKTRAKADLPKVEDLAKALVSKSVIELGNSIRSNIQAMDKMADKGKGLAAHNLRMATRHIEAATLELARRVSQSADVERLERENEQLRSQIGELSKKVDLLTEHLNAPWNSTPQHIPSRLTPNADTEEHLMGRISALIDSKLAALVSTKETEGEQAFKKPVRQGAEKAGIQKQNVSQHSLAPMPDEESTVRKTWAEVAKKNAKNMTGKPKQAPKLTTDRNMESRGVAPKPSAKLMKPGRMPNTAAITITVPPGSESSYAAVMTAAKQRVKLSECGITDSVRTRRAVTGALILEISGTDCSSKADALASKMREVLTDTDAIIARPTKCGEIRIKDLDESITPTDVAAAVAEAGCCSVTEIKVGTIRLAPLRMGTVWVRCPISAVRRIAVAKRICLGWTAAKVEVLAPRPLQCYKCLELGHVRNQCPNEEDRSSRCYSCGDLGHKARECMAGVLKCPLCTDLGRPATHRLGSKACAPKAKAKGKGSKQALLPNDTQSVPEATEPSLSIEN